MTKILIAEDERDIRDLIVFTLEFGGYEVVATTNGAEAVELAPSEKPDLIMLDVRMPKMTGYEACVALKANPATKETPVVFLSAKGQESEVNTGLSAGAMDYILKPFAPDQLIAKVKEALSKKDTQAVPTASVPISAPAPKDTKLDADTDKKEVSPTPPPTEVSTVKEEKKEEPKATTEAKPATEPDKPTDKPNGTIRVP